MPSRRAAIAMTESELHRFLGEERLVTVASIGPNGRPHLMPLYYVADGGEIPDHVREQAPKRVGLVFRPTRVASFDHRKLGSGS